MDSISFLFANLCDLMMGFFVCFWLGVYHRKGKKKGMRMTKILIKVIRIFSSRLLIS